MSRRAIRLLAGAVLVAAVGWVALFFAGDESVDSPAVPAAAVPESRAENEPEPARRRGIARVRVEVSSPELSDDTPSVEPTSLPSDSSSLPIAANSAEDPLDRPIGWPTFEAAEERFSLESRDFAWADQAEANIYIELSQIPDLGLLQVEVQCRSSLCRLDMLFPRGSETTYAIRRINAVAENIGLGQVTADNTIQPGGLPFLKLFLRRQGA